MQQLSSMQETLAVSSNGAVVGEVIAAAYAANLTAWVKAGAGVSAFVVRVKGSLAQDLDTVNWPVLLELAFADDGAPSPLAAPKWVTGFTPGRFKFVVAEIVSVAGGTVDVYLLT